MMNRKMFRLGAGPVLAVGLLLPAVLPGCGEGGLLGDCDPNLSVKFESLKNAADGLMKVSGDMKASLAVGCAAIANGLGQSDVPDVSGASVSDDDMQSACNLASAGIQLELDAGATISLEIVGGQCSVNAEAQFSCEASCDVSGGCEPGSIEVQCSAGEISGECSASCEGSCTVETGSVECSGGCSGKCEGTCSGTCAAENGSGECEGKCEGTCTGSCTGTCEVVPPSATCSGSCKGGCSVEITAPKCEGELTPPSCDLDVDCQAGCDGQAKFEAECTPPSVEVTVNASASANLEGSIKAGIPAVLGVITQAELVVSAAGDVASAFGSAVTALGTAPACVAEFGADFAASVSGSVEASASVSVSVSASAEVGGKAGG